MDNQLAHELLAFESDHVWVYQNMETLLREYEEQWIAAKNGRVIASAPTFQGLLSKLDDPAHACVEFITREPLEMVL